jgi:hypothetical protein
MSARGVRRYDRLSWVFLAVAGVGFILRGVARSGGTDVNWGVDGVGIIMTIVGMAGSMVSIAVWQRRFVRANGEHLLTTVVQPAAETIRRVRAQLQDDGADDFAASKEAHD